MQVAATKQPPSTIISLVGVSIYTLLILAIVGAAIYSANQAKVSADAAVD
jgi:hypothetical protein